MRSLVRPVLAPLTAAAFTLGVCACGQPGAPTGATPTSAPSAATTTAPPTTQAAPSVDEMYTKAMAAVRKSDSVRMKLTITDKTGTTTIDERGTIDGTNMEFIQRAPDGSTSTTRIVAGKVFTLANKTFWRQLLPNAGVKAADLAGRWVLLTGEVPQETPPTLDEALLDTLGQWAPGTTLNRLAEVAVQEATGGRTYRAEALPMNVFTVEASTWLPIRLALEDSQGAEGVMDLSSWDAVDRFTVPGSYLEVKLG